MHNQLLRCSDLFNNDPVLNKNRNKKQKAPIGLTLFTQDGRYKFHHSRNGMPLMADELNDGGNSDDDSDRDEWEVLYCIVLYINGD